VGHSLGAGCALALGFMLRQRYPNLRCLLYSPPGGLVTHRLAKSCTNFVTSFILDSEIVPRLSLQNMERLRDEILDLIQRTKVSKAAVVKDFLQTAAAHALSNHDHPDNGPSGGMPFPDDNSDLLYPKNDSSGSARRMESASVLSSEDGSTCNSSTTEFATQLQHFRDIQRDRKQHRSSFRGRTHIHSPMYPPGKIVHLVKTSETKSCSSSLLKCMSCWTSNAGSQYTPMWAKNEDFDEIVISPTMGTDHFPNRVCLEMEGVASNLFHLQSPYTDLQQEYGV
jgi:sn1-specific diacylglycerol lipase